MANAHALPPRAHADDVSTPSAQPAIPLASIAESTTLFAASSQASAPGFLHGQAPADSFTVPAPRTDAGASMMSPGEGAFMLRALSDSTCEDARLAAKLDHMPTPASYRSGGVGRSHSMTEFPNSGLSSAHSGGGFRAPASGSIAAGMDMPTHRAPLLAARSSHTSLSSDSSSGTATHMSTPPSLRRTSTLSTPVSPHLKRYVCVLGHGVTSDVYRGRHIFQDVAIKVLKHETGVVGDSEDLTTRFEREVEALRLLNGHTHIVRFFGSVEQQTGDLQPALVFELLPYDAAKYFRCAEPDTSLDKFVKLVTAAQQIASALAHIHAHEFVHNDLALRNIMVRADGAAVLCDFGLCVRNIHASRLTIHAPCASLPTVVESDRRMQDVHKFGLLLVELFGEKKVHELARADVHCRAQERMNPYKAVGVPADAVEALIALVRECTKPDAACTIQDVYHELDAILRCARARESAFQLDEFERDMQALKLVPPPGISLRSPSFSTSIDAPTPITSVPMPTHAPSNSRDFSSSSFSRRRGRSQLADDLPPA